MIYLSSQILCPEAFQSASGQNFYMCIRLTGAGLFCADGKFLQKNAKNPLTKGKKSDILFR